MQFVQPTALILLIPAWAFLAWTWPRLHGIARTRKAIVFGIRAVLSTLLVLALAQPQVVKQNKGLCTIFALDRSASVRDTDRKAQIAFVNEAMKQMAPDDVAAVVAFGKEPMIETAPGSQSSLRKIESRIDDTATDLAAAVRLASGLFPEGKNRRIVLLTDGNETNGDAREAAMVAQTQSIQIDTVALGKSASAPEASIVQMEAPGVAHSDEPIRLRLVVESNVNQDAAIEIERDGIPIKRVGTSLHSGQNAIIVEDKISSQGFHRYRASLIPANDTDPRNNLGQAFVAVRNRPRILVLQQNLKDLSLSNAISKSGIEVVTRDVAGIPLSPEEAVGYDSIILNDFNAANFLPAQMKTLEAAVRQSGVGFGMIGGDDSFISGGYFDTPIAEILPVDLNVRQRKEFPSTSVLIVVDASGSMGMVEDGLPKIRLAANAAEQTVKMLSPRDRIGVAGSSDSIDFVAPMQASSDRSQIISQLRKLDIAGGGIYANMSVDFAKKTLEKETTRVRHLILLGDGNDVDTHEGTMEMVLRMRAEHITTTTVAIGDGKDVPFLRDLAAAGGGRFFLADHAGKLPAIMTQDTASIARSAIEEGAFYPKLVGYDQALNGIDSTPPLLAYCLSDRRPLANTSMVTKKDDPLFARWNYGLGNSFAFTSDAKPKWASKWIGWPGFDAFWSQVARSTARQQSSGSYQVAIDQSGGTSKAVITATDGSGNPLTKMDGVVNLTLPDGNGKTLDVTQSAPGVFNANFDSSALGTYIVTVSEPGASGVQRVSSTGFSVPYPPEYRTSQPQEPLLKEVSETTRGKLLKTPTDAIRPPSVTGLSVRDIWPTFVFIGLALLPVDVGMRRIALPFNEIFAWFLRLFKRRERKEVEQTEVIGRLSKAKQRASTPTVAPQEVARPAAASKPVEAKPEQKATGGELSASERLLASKRKRGGDN